MSALPLALGAAIVLLCMSRVQAQAGYGTQNIDWKWRQGRGTYFGGGNWSIHHGEAVPITMRHSPKQHSTNVWLRQSMQRAAVLTASA
jgi:hypothetical protein